MFFEIEYITHNGKVREHNEDSLLVGEEVVSNISMDYTITKKYIYSKDKLFTVVADGMGGHNKGEVASKYVLTKLRNYADNINSKEELKTHILNIKNELDTFAEKNPDFKDMGTVVSGILFLKESYIIFNIGDCRVYENSFGFANQITTDHSLVYKLYQNNEIEYNEINTHPKKNIVTSALIANKEQKLNEVFIKEFELKANKEFLICSDGVWENLDIKIMESCLSSDNSTELLFKEVMKTNASDNLTILIVKAFHE